MHTSYTNTQGFPESSITVARYLNLRYDGTDVAVMTAEPPADDGPGSYAAAFEAAYVREFGFTLRGRAMHVDDVRVRAMACSASVVDGTQQEAGEAGTCHDGRVAAWVLSSVLTRMLTRMLTRIVVLTKCTFDRMQYLTMLTRITMLTKCSVSPCQQRSATTTGPLPPPACVTESFFEQGGRQPTPAYHLHSLHPGHRVAGPAILLDSISTVVVEPGWTAHITQRRDVRLTWEQGHENPRGPVSTQCDPIQLAIFSHRYGDSVHAVVRGLCETKSVVGVVHAVDSSLEEHPSCCSRVATTA